METTVPQVKEAEAKPKSILDILKEEEKGEEGADQTPISPEALAKADLSLPNEFQVDSMAAELVDHLANYHKAVAGRKAARSQGDHQRAEQLSKLAAYSRLAAAYIQEQFPGVKALADEIARARVVQVRNQRKTLLENTGDD